MSDVKIKYNSYGYKIPKFALKSYEFVYQRLMDFPQDKFDDATLTTINFFESIHKIVNAKIHLHHSHVTGKIYRSAYDFWSIKVTETENQFSCFTYKFFGFDMFFLIKRSRLTVWGTKDVNIGETGLTNINFASKDTLVKLNLSIR